MSASGAALLRRVRGEAGLSRCALAARAGVPTSTVSRIENEESDPTLATLERLLAAAGTHMVIDALPRDDHVTLAELSTAVDRDSTRLKIDWTRLRGFVDWASRHPDRIPGAIADPPARTGTVLDAILAGLAEELADRHGLERPRWTRAVGPLSEPWSAPGTPRMRTAAEGATPKPFRRRNLTLASSALFRAER